MSYCKSCGSEVNQNQDFCPNCGASVRQNNQQPQQNVPRADDTGSFGWGFLGFCFPIVGLILFLVWRQDKPLNAKSAGIGAIIGFALGLVSVIIQAIALGGELGGFY